MTMSVNIWLALSWLALCAIGAGGWLLGRNARQHEVEDMHHRIMLLEAALQRSEIDKRDAIKRNQELVAALHHKTILHNAITEPVRLTA